MLDEPSRREFAFVCGVHRSGTSLLYRCIGQHPAVSRFTGTGVPEDEGQHLQSIFPTPRHRGGPHAFAWHPEMRLTEQSEWVSETNRQRLFEEWASHWDLSRRVLLEKSPPNIIKTRFLQALFPNSSFIFIMRHPVAACLALKAKAWNGSRRASLDRLIEHWCLCHEYMAEDLPFLRRTLVLRYEDFVAEPPECLDQVFALLSLPPISSDVEVHADMNRGYFEQWQYRWRRPFRFSPPGTSAELEERVNRFGYSLRDVDQPGDLPDSLRTASVALNPT